MDREEITDVPAPADPDAAVLAEADTAARRAGGAAPATVDAAAPPEGAAQSSVGRLVRRAGWNLVDQALSSFSNLALSLLVAKAVDSEAFGAFTVSFTVYSVAVLVSRALCSQPLMMRFTAVGPDEFRTAAGQSTGTAAAVGFGLGLVALVGGLLIGSGGGVGTALLAMALLMPGLLVQDAWRMAFFAQGRPDLSALLDGVWTVLQLVGVAIVLAVGLDSAVPFVIAWGLAAAAAGALGAQRGSVLPQLRGTAAWLRAHWDLTKFLLMESLLLQGAYQGALLLVGAFGSLSDVGYLRGAQVLIGPLSLLAASATAFGIPEISRRPQLRARPRLLAAAALGGALAIGGLVWGVGMLLLPDAWGTALLGDSWNGVHSVLLASVVGQVGNLLSVGPAIVVYGMGRGDAIFRIHAAVSGMLIVFGMSGLYLGGGAGAAWGFALAYWVAMPFWFRRVRILGRENDAAHDAAPDAAHDAETTDLSGTPQGHSPAQPH